MSLRLTDGSDLLLTDGLSSLLLAESDPSVTATTDRIYQRLPEHYRNADALQGPLNLPLLRYLSLTGDQLDEISDLADRVGTDLMDPDATPVFALDWLAQFVGEQLMPLLSVTKKRDTIKFHESWGSGEPGALIAKVQTILTGTKRVTLVEHWGGNGLVIAVWTYASESPAPAIVLAAVLSQKPAGIGLADVSPVKPGLTWYDAAKQYATWSAFAAAGSKTWVQRATEVPTYAQGY